MNEFEAQVSEILVWITRNFTRCVQKRQLKNKKQKQMPFRFMLIFLSVVVASYSLNLCDQLKSFTETYLNNIH